MNYPKWNHYLGHIFPGMSDFTICGLDQRLYWPDCYCSSCKAFIAPCETCDRFAILVELGE